MSDTADDIRADFLTEAGELVANLGEQLVRLESQPKDPDLLNAIFRAFHTVKGGAGFLNLTPLVALCHAAEDVFNLVRNGKREVDAALMDAVLASLDEVQRMMALVGANAELTPTPASLIDQLHRLASGTAPTTAAAKPVASAPASDTISDDEFEALLDQLAAEKKNPTPPTAAVTPPPPAPVEKPVAASPPPAPPADTTIRVEASRLDQMMNRVGELVLVRNRLKALRGAGSEEISRAISQLDFITRGLQDAVMQVRMQPVRKVFSRFPKLARDVARGLGKQVDVVLSGEDTGLDKNLVEALADPLVHMVRNSVDHGVELPETRLKAGKPAAGRLELMAQQAGDHILITVRDDGAGMDPERLKAKALQKGLIDAATAARMSSEEALQLIFAAGFSTKEQITDLSGRGVGMDVVKTAIGKLNGSVVVESRLGQGSSIRIRVPLTLAILPALMVQVGPRQFALPLGAVLDVFVLDESKVRKLNQWEVIPLKRDTLRLVRVRDWIDPAASTSGEAGPRHVVVVQIGEERYGLVVSLVRGREEVVIKPLGARLHGLLGVSGATVTPEGRVALILDLPGVITAYAKSLG